MSRSTSVHSTIAIQNARQYCGKSAKRHELWLCAVGPAHLSRGFSLSFSSHLSERTRSSLVLLPFALETLGGLHKGAITQVKLIATALARCKGVNEGEATGQLFGRLSLILMKANSLMLSTRCQDADFPSPAIDGIEWLLYVMFSMCTILYFFGNKRFHTVKPALHQCGIPLDVKAESKTLS